MTSFGRSFAFMLVALPLACATLIFAAPAQAQDGFPTKQIRIIVPFAPGGATDLLGGVFDAQFDNMVTLIPHVKAGKLRALAVSSARRVPLLPDVPTIAESALPGFETGTWYGIVAPAGTPPPVVARLNREVNRILALPDVQDRLLAQGLEPAGNTPAEFAAMIRSEIAKYAKIVKAAGIKAE